MAIDHNIPLQAQSFDMLGMLGRGSELAQFYTKQKTDNEMTRIYNESQGDLDKMLSIAPQSKMARWVMPQLQSQKAAQQKAALDQQQSLANVSKTQSEAFKNNTQGQGYGLDNSGKVGLAVQKAISHASITGDKNAALIGLRLGLGSGEIPQGVYENAVSQLNTLTNPKDIKNFAMGMLDAKYSHESADNAADNITSRANTKDTLETQKEIAGDRLEFEKGQAEKPKFVKEITAPDGTVYGIYSDGSADVMSTKSGGVVKGQGGASKMTEQQSKDALFGGRMQEANKILLSLEKNGVKAPVMNSLPYGDKFSNVLPSILGGASSEQQQYVQAQRDFINAVLRKESGAVIADSEFENAQKQYFPQIGDSPAVIAQKAKNRELAVTMIVNASGSQGKEQISQAVGNKGIPYANAGQTPQGGGAVQNAVSAASSKWGI